MKAKWRVRPVLLCGLMGLMTLWITASWTAAAPTDAPVAPEAEIVAELPAAVAGVADAIGLVAPPTAEPAVSTEPVVPAEPVVATVPEIKAVGDVIPRWTLDGVSIQGALQMLSVRFSKNIIASKEVTGDVKADLHDVTFREALDAILRVNGMGYVEKGNFIYVYTEAQLAAIKKAERQMATRVFTLHYVKAGDIKELIVPCLSGEGTIAATPTAASGIGTSDSEAGGMDYAASDVLVVRDYPENIAHVVELLKQVDKRPQQVLIEATILRATLTENTALGIDFSVLAGVDFNLDTNFTDGISGSQGALNIGLTGSDVSMFVRALEGVTDTTVLANPKLLVLNKQRGEVLVGRRDGYIVTTITETSASEGVEFLETGTRLVVRPYIGGDGYVRLEIHPEDSSGSVNNGLPSETTTECTSNVLVKDGRTIVIGGLFREITTNGRSQVPVLGNIPYAGPLFRRTNDSTEREEVIILITPRIIKNAPDEIASEQLRDDIERFRLGQRQHLAWFGRSRLAVRHLDWAKQHLAAGRTKEAMWDVKMTLSLSPSMHEALVLKERLTGDATWAREPRLSSSRYILQKMILNDMGIDVNSASYPPKPLDAEKLPQSVRDAMGIGNLPESDPVPDPTPKPEERTELKPDPDPADDAMGEDAPEEAGDETPE